MKKIQVGARITEKDADFLNLLEINGAHTPSDKIRAIIEEARLRREYVHDFRGSFRLVQEQLGPMIEKMKKAEFENNIHSALLTRILEWLPDFYAYCLASMPDQESETVDFLEKYEKGAVDRIARLFESLLHLELSTQATSYNENIFRDHVQSLAEIIKIIETSSPSKEGKR